VAAAEVAVAAAEVVAAVAEVVAAVEDKGGNSRGAKNQERKKGFLVETL
jgi:hypothetical protein